MQQRDSDVVGRLTIMLGLGLGLPVTRFALLKLNLTPILTLTLLTLLTLLNLLLTKLFNYGITGNIHSWFCDYLSDRKQYVCISGISSDLGKISCGVPQGSVLGPLLFLANVNSRSRSLYAIARPSVCLSSVCL